MCDSNILHDIILKLATGNRPKVGNQLASVENLEEKCFNCRCPRIKNSQVAFLHQIPKRLFRAVCPLVCMSAMINFTEELPQNTTVIQSEHTKQYSKSWTTMDNNG